MLEEGDINLQTSAYSKVIALQDVHESIHYVPDYYTGCSQQITNACVSHCQVREIEQICLVMIKFVLCLWTTLTSRDNLCSRKFVLACLGIRMRAFTQILDNSILQCASSMSPLHWL